jgi:hypothetical protein
MGKPEEPLLDLEWLSGYLGGIPERTIYNWRQRNEGPPAYRWADTCATVAVTSKPGLIAAATRRVTITTPPPSQRHRGGERRG